MIGNIGISDVPAVTFGQVMEGPHARWKLFDMPPPDAPEPLVITRPTDLPFRGVDPPPGTTVVIIVPGHGKIVVVVGTGLSSDILCHWFHRCQGSR